MEARYLLADRGYDSDAIVNQAEVQGIESVASNYFFEINFFIDFDIFNNS